MQRQQNTGRWAHITWDALTLIYARTQQDAVGSSTDTQLQNTDINAYILGPGHVECVCIIYFSFGVCVCLSIPTGDRHTVLPCWFHCSPLGKR